MDGPLYVAADVPQRQGVKGSQDDRRAGSRQGAGGGGPRFLGWHRHEGDLAGGLEPGRVGVVPSGDGRDHRLALGSVNGGGPPIGL